MDSAPSAPLRDAQQSESDTNRPRIVHVVYASQAPVALCGWRCTELYPEGTHGYSCVVCLDLDQAARA